MRQRAATDPIGQISGESKVNHTRAPRDMVNESPVYFLLDIDEIEACNLDNLEC